MKNIHAKKEMINYVNRRNNVDIQGIGDKTDTKHKNYSSEK